MDRTIRLVIIALLLPSIAAAEPESGCWKITQQLLGRSNPDPSPRVPDSAEARRLRADVARLEAAKADLQRARAKDASDFDRQIRDIGRVIAAGRAAAQARIADYSERARKNNARLSRLAREEVAKTRRQLADGSFQHYSPPHRVARTLTGWKAQIGKLQAKKRERLAKYDAGKWPVWVESLQAALPRRALLRRIEDIRAKLAKLTVRRAPRPSGSTTVAAQIVAGTYKMRIAGFDGVVDRNTLQRRIARSHRRFGALYRQWQQGTYEVDNAVVGSRISIGRIRAELARLQADRRGITGAGEGYAMIVPGHGRVTSGQALRAATERAFRAGRVADGQRLQAAYQSWKGARDAKLTGIRLLEARWTRSQAASEKRFSADRSRIISVVRDVLSPALHRLPCARPGSGVEDTDYATVERHLGRLSAAERERYLDALYVEADGTVHGVPAAAWDSIRQRGVSAEDTPGQQLNALRRGLSFYKAAEKLMGVDFANARIDRFAAAVDAIEGQDKNLVRHLKSVRREHLAAVTKAIETGFLSPRRLEATIAALQRAKPLSMHHRRVLRQLRAMATISQSLHRGGGLSRLKGLASAVRLTTPGHLEALRRVFRAPASVAGRQALRALKDMNGLDRLTVFLSAVKNSREARLRIQAGVVPSQALFAAAVKTVIDMGLTKLPIAGAIDLGVKLIVYPIAAETGADWAYGLAPSTLAKNLADGLIGAVADGSAWLADGPDHLRTLVGRPTTRQQLVANVSSAQLRRSLSLVERTLDSLSPGAPDVPRLLRTRAALRRLLRAQ